jgi:hypothetical protein
MFGFYFDEDSIDLGLLIIDLREIIEGKYCVCPVPDSELEEREMNNNGRNNNKAQRLDDEGDKTDGPPEIDVRLSEELRGLLGGRKFMKAKDLTREILLEYAKRQGAVTEVDLLSVTVQTMEGTELEMQLEESKNTVKCLKLAIQDEQGISTFTQQLFLVSKSKDNAAADAIAGAGVKQEPLKDEVLVSDSSIVALCVDFSAALNEWDSSSPLISVSIAFCSSCC